MKDLHLRGIPEIGKVYVQEAKIKCFDMESGALLDKQKEWELLTDGTKLKEIFLLEKVNFRRVTSNDILQIYECLGIEAVRNTLIQELRKVLGHYGIYVNYRHLAILCDVMTQNGYLTSITRHGINRVEQGPLRKCSFEETVEILLEAGLFAEIDSLKGISENIMLGQLGPFGTGYFDLLLDIDKIKKADFIDEKGKEEELNEEDELIDNLGTPDANLDPNYSPTQLGMKTPGQYNTPNPYGGFAGTYSNTPGPYSQHKQSPNFTPINRSLGSTPIYDFKSRFNDNEPVVNITSPYPNMKNYTTSPGYNPSEHAYSPIYDSDTYEGASKYGSSYYGAESYSSKESMPTKSPCIGQAYSRYNISSPVAYSPGSPIIKTTKGMSSNYAYSPSYNLHNTASANITYSPTTPLNHQGTSPEYSKGNFYSIRSSSHSVINSPKLNYTTASPTYNPKSPAYNNMPSISSKYFNALYF